jgi:hypothetical protein
MENAAEYIQVIVRGLKPGTDFNVFAGTAEAMP